MEAGHGINTIRGIRISTLNIGMLIFAGMLCVALLYATYMVTSTYEELSDSTADSVTIELKAVEVHDASEYLTEQVRFYVETTEPFYAEQYFEEVNVTRRRESALMALEQYPLAASCEASMEAAIRCSQELALREVYAMRLVAEGSGSDLSALPPEIQAVVLEPEDAALASNAKIEKGQLMVFDEVYLACKAEIYGHLDDFTEGVLSIQEERILDGVENLSHVVWFQRILLGILIGGCVLFCCAILLLVEHPLRSVLRCFRAQTPLEVKGAYEFKYIATVYNDIYRHNEVIVANEKFLRHKAEHDGLTGLLNRGEFMRVSELLKESHMPVALLLVDIDLFKQVNDTYGHTTGDKLLKQVAALLKENFRAQDYLFRIGGDEFACMVTDLSAEQAHVVTNKIQRINERLTNPKDSLPPVSLSVGIAFSPDGYQDVLYEQADAALYRVKVWGRNGCAVYDGRSAAPKPEGDHNPKGDHDKL